MGIHILAKLRIEFSLRKIIPLDLSLLSKLLLVVIIFEVIIESGRRSEALKDSYHPLTSFRINFLAVSSLTGWFVLIEWVLNVDKLSIWNILDEDPFNPERARPLARLFPELSMVLFVVDSLSHFGNTTEML